MYKHLNILHQFDFFFYTFHYVMYYQLMSGMFECLYATFEEDSKIINNKFHTKDDPFHYSDGERFGKEEGYTPMLNEANMLISYWSFHSDSLL